MRFDRSLRHLPALAAGALALLPLAAAAQTAPAKDAPAPGQGSFSQAIPLEVPGFHGLEPPLALTYSSDGRHGQAGVGWNIAGFSYVVRVNATGRGVPRFDASDVYLLEGQELMPCAPGSTSPSCTTGGTHTVKRHESYVRIRRDEAADTWSVWSKDGTRTDFTPIYRMPNVLRWSQAKVTDTHGNAVQYKSRCIELGCYPDVIIFGPYWVKFHWEARPDAATFAVGQPAWLGQTTQRLRSVLIARQFERIRAYKLSYTTSPLTGRSLLSSVQQFGRDVAIDESGVITGGTSLPARTFTYLDDPAGRGFHEPSE